MKKALITGISGQIGSHLADLLLVKGYEVHGIVRRTSKPAEVLDCVKPEQRHQLRLHSADLTDQYSLSTVLKEVMPDEIYNLAAQSFVPTSWTQPALTADVTALGVLRMLEATRHTCPEARFYQASSSEVFGKVRETPQNELTPFYPRSPYGVAKAFGHMITVNYRESWKMYAVSGICFNCEGPRRGAEFVTRKITQAVARIAGGSTEKLMLGNLDASRDWGFAGDYVRAMWLTLQQPEASDYVIATGETHTVRDFCRAAFKYVGLNDWEDFVGVDPKFIRPAEVDLLVGDPAKLRSIGWSARVKFEELVHMMVDADLERGP